MEKERKIIPQNDKGKKEDMNDNERKREIGNQKKKGGRR